MRLRLALSLLLLAAGTSAMAANELPLAPYSLPRSATYEVRSATGETYAVMVAWPEGPPPAAGWPVLYLLDGEDGFAIAALTARRLARAGQRSGIEPGVVVGIGAGPLARRVRDYTPAAPGYRIPVGQPASGLETGGADGFIDLLERRIMPSVRGRWRIDPARETLAGHSFGGLLGLHALFARPALFDGVVAISPSLWYGDGLIDREATAPAAPAPRRLLVAEADERGGAGETSAAAFITRLRQAQPAVRGAFLPLAGQSHGTTFLAAIAPAIDFAFGRPDR